MLEIHIWRGIEVVITGLTRNPSNNFEFVGTQISANAVTVWFSAISADKTKNLI